jgi:hypothetical protein
MPIIEYITFQSIKNVYLSDVILKLGMKMKACAAEIGLEDFRTWRFSRWHESPAKSEPQPPMVFFYKFKSCF